MDDVLLAPALLALVILAWELGYRLGQRRACDASAVVAGQLLSWIVRRLYDPDRDGCLADVGLHHSECGWIRCPHTGACKQPAAVERSAS